MPCSIRFRVRPAISRRRACWSFCPRAFRRGSRTAASRMPRLPAHVLITLRVMDFITRSVMSTSFICRSRPAWTPMRPMPKWLNWPPMTAIASCIRPWAGSAWKRAIGGASWTCSLRRRNGRPAGTWPSRASTSTRGSRPSCRRKCLPWNKCSTRAATISAASRPRSTSFRRSRANRRRASSASSAAACNAAWPT